MEREQITVEIKNSYGTPTGAKIVVECNFGLGSFVRDGKRPEELVDRVLRECILEVTNKLLVMGALSLAKDNKNNTGHNG